MNDREFHARDAACYSPRFSEKLAQKIPDHLLVDMLSDFIESRDEAFCRTSQVCRSWNRALSDSSFWESRLRSRFGLSTDLYHPGYRDRFESHSTDSSESEAHPKEVYGATHALERRFSSGAFVARSRTCIRATITSACIRDETVFLSDSFGSIYSQSVSPPSGGEGNFSCPLPSPILTCSCPVSCLSVSVRSFSLVAGLRDGSILMWPDLTIDPVLRKVHSSRISGLASTADSLIFVSTNDGLLSITDLQTGDVVSNRRFAPEASPNAVSVCGENTILVGCRDNSCRLVDSRTDAAAMSIPLSDWCLCVEGSDTFLIRASDKAVNLFDLRNVDNAIDARHRSHRLVSKFKSDQALRLVSCGLDGEVKVSSLESLAAPISVHAEDDYILAIDFDRTTMCCGGMRGKLETFIFN